MRYWKIQTLLAALVVSKALSVEPPQITAEPNSVPFGESCLLRWTNAGSTAFVSTVGIVPASGSRQITPGASTTYFLWAEQEGKLVWTSVNVSVSGQKGELVWPEQTSLLSPVTGNGVTSNFFGLLATIEKVLSEELAFEHKNEFILSTRTFKIYTNYRDEPPELPRDFRRKRRVAYCVEINMPEDVKQISTVPYTVRVSLQQRRTADRQWSRDEDSETAINLAKKVLGKITNPG